MAGLTREGFTPSSYSEIYDRISKRLIAFSPKIDLSTESPDGQLLEIFSFELSQVWSELDLVYNSYNPNRAVGEGLRNLGLITGLPFGGATRSQAMIQLTGTEGVRVPKGSIVTDDEGNEFITQLAANITSTVQVVAAVPGPIPIKANTLTTIKTPVTGWTGIIQAQDGNEGVSAQSETAYRNLRNQTVLRNYTSVPEVLTSRLFEDLGIEQVSIVNNDTPNEVDGVPANTIHVTVGEVGGVTDKQIAEVILATKPLGCPTYGTTTVQVPDTQGRIKNVSFSKANPVTIWVKAGVTFLTDDNAGAEAAIVDSLKTHINSLLAGEDVIWSRLFGLITPYGKAQVDSLEISSDGITYVSTNIALSLTEFAVTETGNIQITDNTP